MNRGWLYSGETPLLPMRRLIIPLKEAVVRSLVPFGSRLLNSLSLGVLFAGVKGYISFYVVQ